VIALSFALPEESKDFVRQLAGARRSGPPALPVIAGSAAGREVVVVHSGMGMASAAARLGGFLENCAPSAWIASGFGGALAEDLCVGDIVAGRNFSDSAMLEAVASLSVRAGDLITTKAVVESAAQKKDLARHTGAIVADMETAAIHRLCAARGIPMLAIRVISDTASDDLLPTAIWFDIEKQRPRPLPLLLHLAAHPGRIGPFASFVRGIGRARSRLTEFLLAALAALPEK
jgi:adenosylhomocysteine nucleosidase